MIEPKIHQSLKAAIDAFSQYTPLDAQFFPRMDEVFSSDKDFMEKVADMDAVLDDTPAAESLREVFFDMLMINFFTADIKRLEEDYLETPEWEQIEEETLDRGTELLNLLLYLNECREENIEPSLEDYLKEFLLVDEDEFQDEHRIYEDVIANQILVESPVGEISKVAANLPDDSEIKELFYPMMSFFQNLEPSANDKQAIAASAIDKDFDIAVFEILITFK